VRSLGILSVVSDNSMCPGSAQPLKMSTRIFMGYIRPVRMVDNLPPSSDDNMESGNLNLPDPSGSHRPVMGLLYLLLHNTENKYTCNITFRRFRTTIFAVEK
jgi:hypothetical protein